MINSIEIGKKIKFFRKLKEMSQKDLGEALQLPITSQQIHKYENGSNDISVVKLFEISKILKIDFLYFFKELPNFNKN